MEGDVETGITATNMKFVKVHYDLLKFKIQMDCQQAVGI